MRAVALTAFDAPAALCEDLPTPTLAPNEVLVRVQASSVNPVDNAIAAGLLGQMGFEYEFPVILGRDYAGVVEQVGPEVTSNAVGDEVFGFILQANPTVRDGSWAELIAVPDDISSAAVPTGVGLAAVGAAPVAGITAMLAIDALDLSNGDTLLVVGATGGVGSFAVQLGVRAGATVTAPALPEDEAYLRELGVGELLPRDGELEAVALRHPDGFDAILDLVSFTGDAAPLLKEGGRLASTLGAAGEGPGRINVMAAPTRENLQRLAGLLGDGVLRVPVFATYELAQAPEALHALSTTHIQGKLAIRVD